MAARSARTDWLVTQYETIRGEIGERSSTHHSMLGWAAALCAGYAALADELSFSWIGPVLLIAFGSICVVVFEWMHTKRLGAYAAQLEEELADTAGMTPDDPLRGWELHLLSTRLPLPSDEDT